MSSRGQESRPKITTTRWLSDGISPTPSGGILRGLGPQFISAADMPKSGSISCRSIPHTILLTVVPFIRRDPLASHVVFVPGSHASFAMRSPHPACPHKPLPFPKFSSRRTVNRLIRNLSGSFLVCHKCVAPALSLILMWRLDLETYPSLCLLAPSHILT